MKKERKLYMGLFSKLSSIFKSNKSTVKDYVDPKTGAVTKSSVFYNKAEERFLKLDNDSCAMVIHPGGKVEVVFTKLYDKDEQRVTAEEETLMSIALFMRQPGFAELLRNEFHNIAMDNISKLTEVED
jgi:hypothetical protein